MQKSLSAFPGFSIKKQGSQPLFNPFEFERSQEPTRSKDVIEALNVLDSTQPVSEGEPLILFPQKPVEDKSVIEHEVSIVPMNQPRSKEGQRLLYTHPTPRVGVKGAYYLLVGESDRSQTAHLVQFDGGARPNPGPAAAAAVLWSPPDLEGKRTPIFESGKYLGKATNNIAEVQGLLLGLQIAAMRGAREILIEGDSELIIFQQIRKYKVSDKNLKVWWANIQAAMMDETSFDWIAIRQVKREFNQRADSVAGEVLSKKQSFQR